MRKVFYAKVGMKIVIIMKFIYIIIMKNWEVFGKKAFLFFLEIFFLNFVFCWLEVFFKILGSAWYFFC